MKKVTFLFLVIFTGGLAAQDTLVFNALDKGTEKYEAVIEEIYSRMGIPVTFRVVPADRALHYSNSGTTDGEMIRALEIGSYYTNLKPVPVAVDTLYNSAYTVDSSIVINDITDLQGYKIGTLKGVRQVEQLLKDMDLYPGTQIPDVFKMLMVGEVDVVVVPDLVTLEQLDALGFPGLIKSQTPLWENKLFHFINVKHEELIPRLTDVINEMIEDGTMEKLGMNP